MEDSPGSSHLEGKLLVAEAYPGGGLAYGCDTGSGMTLGEVTAMIGMITARPEESGSDYATGHESTVGSPLDLAVGLRQGQPAYSVEEDTNMESAPWGYRSFERIRMVNQFGEAAERIVIHEWTLETHDLATLPAQVEELTGALNYLQNFNFEAVSAISEIRQVIQALSRELELHARGVQVDGSALTARVEALGQLFNEVNNEVQDQRSRLDSKRAEMQSTLEQATAAALKYRQVAEALKAKVDNSRQGWEQATNELKRQLEGVLNEVTGLISHRAQLDNSVQELKSLEGKVLNCDRVTTNVAEEIRRIGLNFGDAKKRVHGVEAMVESHMPKPELANVEALELQVRLLMTRSGQSEHEVHALREEIRTRPHGGPPEGMRSDYHVIGELQRKLESLENKYQLLKHAGTPSVNPIGIPTPTPKPEPRVRFLECQRGKNGLREAYRGLDSPRRRMTCRPCGRMNRVSGEEPQGERGVGPAPQRDTPRRTWVVIGGIAPGWTSATSRRTVMVGLCHGWCFNCSTDRNLSRMGLGFRNKSRREFYGQWRLMKFVPNNFRTPHSTGKSHNLKDRIRG